MDLFKANRKKYIFLGCILGLLVFFLFRGCNHDPYADSLFRIGQDSRWPTLYLMGKDRNLAAFNNELLGQIGRDENLRIKVFIAPENELLDDLENKKLEGVITLLDPDYSNQDRLVFSEPYFLVGPVLVIPATSPYEGWNEQAKKIIGISSQFSKLKILEEDPTNQLKIYYDILAALHDLRDHKIDGVIFPLLPVYIYVNTFYKDELKIATLPLTDEGLRLAALNNDKGKHLVKAFGEGLAKLKASDEYSKLLEQWGFIDAEHLD